MSKRPALCLTAIMLLLAGGAGWWLWTKPAPAGAELSSLSAVRIDHSVIPAPGSLAPIPPEAPALHDRYAQSIVVARREAVGASIAGGKRLRKERLVRDQSTKYPLLRVIEEWHSRGPAQTLISQK